MSQIANCDDEALVIISCWEYEDDPEIGSDKMAFTYNVAEVAQDEDGTVTIYRDDPDAPKNI